MPWTRPTLTQLVIRMEADLTSRLTGGAALLRRSILAILARVFAGAAHIMYGFLEFIAAQIFIDTAESDYLDRHALIWGVPRTAAAFGVGTITVTGVDGTEIPAGTIFLRDDGIEYTTDALAEVGSTTPGEVDIAVTCNTAGETGNSATGLILQIETPILDIDDEATVITPGIAGGVETETDDALRVRILARIQNPPAGGADADYIAWAKSIAGIADAFVFANYYGLGTVAVACVVDGIPGTPGSYEPSAPLIAEVQAYIDTVRPVTAAVTVVPIVEVEVGFNISITPNTSALRAAVTNAVAELFADDAAPAGTLLISHINEAILTSGIEDFEITDFFIDGVSTAYANYTFTGFEFPVIGVFTFADL